MIRSYLFSASLFLGMAAPSLGNTPALSREDNERALQLLRKLGAKEYKIRESAGNELVKMGRAVEPVLRLGLTDSDPEIRFRSRYLLPLALTYDLEKRILAFLADKDDKAPLPCWTKFKEAVGDGDKTRDLFAAMHRTDTEILELLEKNPANAQAKISSRCNEFMWSRNYGGYNTPVSTEQIALLLFAIQNPKLKLEVTARANFSNALHSLSYSPQGKNVLKGNEVVRKLIVKYLTNWNENTIHSDIYLLVNLEIKEGLGIAREMLKKSENQPWLRAMALGALAKLGGKEVIPEILPFLEDKGSCGTTQFGMNNKNVTMTTQLRDVALGMLVHLTGQNLGDYEFAYMKAFPGNFSAQNLFMSPTLLGFSDDKGRDISMKKWKDWYEKEKANLPQAPKK
jgi:hypothetical protein